MNETAAIADLEKVKERPCAGYSGSFIHVYATLPGGILQKDVAAEDVVQDAFMKRWRQQCQPASIFSSSSA